jgi:hypothetical protein
LIISRVANWHISPAPRRDAQCFIRGCFVPSPAALLVCLERDLLGEHDIGFRQEAGIGRRKAQRRDFNVVLQNADVV